MCALPQAPAEGWLGGWDPAHTVHQNWCPVAELHISRGRGNLYLAQKCYLLAKPYMRVCIFIEELFLLYLPRERAFKKFIQAPYRQALALITEAGYQIKWFGQDSVHTKNQKVFFRPSLGREWGWAERGREAKLDNGWERQREKEEEGWVAKVLMIYLGDVCSHELHSQVISTAPRGLSFLLDTKMLWNAHTYFKIFIIPSVPEAS